MQRVYKGSNTELESSLFKMYPKHRGSLEDPELGTWQCYSVTRNVTAWISLLKSEVHLRECSSDVVCGPTSCLMLTNQEVLNIFAACYSVDFNHSARTTIYLKPYQETLSKKTKISMRFKATHGKVIYITKGETFVCLPLDSFVNFFIAKLSVVWQGIVSAKYVDEDIGRLISVSDMCFCTTPIRKGQL